MCVCVSFRWFMWRRNSSNSDLCLCWCPSVCVWGRSFSLEAVSLNGDHRSYFIFLSSYLLLKVSHPYKYRGCRSTSTWSNSISSHKPRGYNYLEYSSKVLILYIFMRSSMISTPPTWLVLRKVMKICIALRTWFWWASINHKTTTKNEFKSVH